MKIISFCLISSLLLGQACSYLFESEMPNIKRALQKARAQPRFKAANPLHKRAFKAVGKSISSLRKRQEEEEEEEEDGGRLNLADTTESALKLSAHISIKLNQLNKTNPVFSRTCELQGV